MNTMVTVKKKKTHKWYHLQNQADEIQIKFSELVSAYS